MTEQAREEADALVADTTGITSATALRARTSALEKVVNAETVVTQLTNQLGQAEGQQQADSARLIVAEMKEAAEAAEVDLKASRRDIREALEAAEVEIAALKKQHAHQAALDEAINAAQQYTDHCSTLVSAAWEAYNGAPPELGTTNIARAIELRSTAHEIIDIADYQAKEAAVAAKQAREYRPVRSKFTPIPRVRLRSGSKKIFPKPTQLWKKPLNWRHGKFANLRRLALRPPRLSSRAWSFRRESLPSLTQE